MTEEEAYQKFCRSVDRLFRNLALWQTETFELFNDFCLLLYAFAPGITADFLDSGESIRAEDRRVF